MHIATSSTSPVRRGFSRVAASSVVRTSVPRKRVAGTGIRNGFRRAFARAVGAAGLPDDFRRHDLRHARATTWLAEGRNVVHVKQALGHAALATTMASTHLADEHVAALLEPTPINRERRVTVT